MSGEYIKQTKASVYILGSPNSSACLYDFDGEYVLDGGLEEKKIGFTAHVKNVAAVLLSAPTKKNIGTATALKEHDPNVFVFANSKPIKTAKEGSVGADLKSVQVSSSHLFPTKPFLFNPKYEPYILYQSMYKGQLSLYILAGDAKDADVITQAISTGSEQQIEKAAAEHGTIGILLWRPAEADKPITRVLLTGICTFTRIHQALEKASKALPFLNAPIVKSKDVFSNIPIPKVAPEAKVANSSSLSRGAPTPRPNSRAAAPTRAPAARSAVPARSSIAPKPATGAAAPTRTRTVPSAAPPAKKPLPTRAPPAKKLNEAPAQKTIVGKVQAKPASSRPASAITKKNPENKLVNNEKKMPIKPIAPPVVVDCFDDSSIIEITPDVNEKPVADIIVIPPTPEPTRDLELSDLKESPKNVDPAPAQTGIYPDITNDGDNQEPVIPPPVDAFKEDDDKETKDVKPAEPAADNEPTVNTNDVPNPIDDNEAHPAPSAPPVDDEVVIVEPKPDVPEPPVAVPFIPACPADNREIINMAPGFEEPLVPQGPREDGLLPDCGEEVQNLKKISMDTDRDVTAPGEVSKLVSEFDDLQLEQKESTVVSDSTNVVGSEDYARKLSAQMIHDASMPFTSAFANSIVGAAENAAAEVLETQNLIDIGTTNESEEKKVQDIAEKHELMQSRSSVIENGAKVDYEKTDPAIEGILDACVMESDKIDALVGNEHGNERNAERLEMIEKPSVVYKGPKFSRPFYFDVVSVPRNDKQETTLDEHGLRAFVSRVRSRNYILASRDIATSQLDGFIQGKQQWTGDKMSATVVPLNSSTMLSDFKHRNEAALEECQLKITSSVDKQRTTINSGAENYEYELCCIALRDD